MARKATKCNSGLWRCGGASLPAAFQGSGFLSPRLRVRLALLGKSTQIYLAWSGAGSHVTHKPSMIRTQKSWYPPRRGNQGRRFDSRTRESDSLVRLGTSGAQTRPGFTTYHGRTGVGCALLRRRRRFSTQRPYPASSNPRTQAPGYRAVASYFGKWRKSPSL